MHDDRWDAVDAYTTGLLQPADPALEAALKDSAVLPNIAVSAPQGQFLHLLARTISARRILEIGTLGGYSAIWMGRALPEGGRLISLELDERRAEVARRNIARAGLDGNVEVRVAQPWTASRSSGPIRPRRSILSSSTRTSATPPSTSATPSTSRIPAASSSSTTWCARGS
jgi:predicted O-methyltransferase YrrM